MNLEIIQMYAESYKARFPIIHREEIYKWRAVYTFQKHFDIEVGNFHEMLTRALSKTNNLMDTGSYFPRRMILRNAEKSPEEVRSLFADLYSQDDDRIERIKRFSHGIELLQGKNFKNMGLHSYQDPRAIIVYLNLRYPADNYFYKYQMFKSFVEKIEYDYRPKPGAIANIVQFYAVCDMIKEILIRDNTLIQMHHKRLGETEYHDTNLNILTQDFIYAVTTHLNIQPSVSQRKNTLEENSLNLEISKKKIFFYGQQSDHERKAKKNKYIGNLGELLVLHYEKEHTPAKLKKFVTHDSKMRGDGLGYDIKSVDSDGKEKFIEVKTTKGSFNTPFFITAHELERSRKEDNKYYLYRIFHYSERTNSGQLQIVRGNLNKFCNNPVQFEVILKTV